MKTYILQRFQQLKISHNHLLRKAIGILLIMGGILGFLPVLGYWMLPLGLALLAVDWHWARRLYRRMKVWYGRRVIGRKKKFSPRR